MMRRSWLGCALLVLTLALAAPAAASAGDMRGMDMSHGRYYGKPDLALTSAMIAAGGGVRHFDAARLSAMLTAQHHDAEFASLEARYGKQRVDTYFATFDAFIDGAIHLVGPDHVRIPHPNPLLAHDSYELAASLRQAGIMPDGRFDVGYMIEHLLSRPMHKQLMTQANDAPSIGPERNADFHVILTAEMNDLKTLYHLPQ